MPRLAFPFLLHLCLIKWHKMCHCSLPMTQFLKIKNNINGTDLPLLPLLRARRPQPLSWSRPPGQLRDFNFTVCVPRPFSFHGLIYCMRWTDATCFCQHPATVNFLNFVAHVINDEVVLLHSWCYFSLQKGMLIYISCVLECNICSILF